MTLQAFPRVHTRGSPGESQPRKRGQIQDVSLTFRLHRDEEAEFLCQWAERRVGGSLERDGLGFLMFRVGIADFGALSQLNIGEAGLNSRSLKRTWLQAYDLSGTRWLSQLRIQDFEKLPDLFDASGEPVECDGRTGLHDPSILPHEEQEMGRELFRDGIIGIYGPSGLTVDELVARQKGQNIKDGAGENPDSQDEKWTVLDSANPGVTVAAL